MGIYLTFIFTLTVSPVYGFSFPYLRGNINLIPFVVFTSFPDGTLNFIGNILMFIPMGAILRMLTGKRPRPSQILIGTTVSCLIEVIQLFTTRGTDIDDVWLNTLGTVIGWLFVNAIYKLCAWDRKGGNNAQKYPQRVSRVGSLVGLSLVVVMVVGFCSRSRIGYELPAKTEIITKGEIINE